MGGILIGIVAISLLTKVVIHSYLDKKHNKYEGPYSASMYPFEYAFPYMRPVKDEFAMAKKICNLAYTIMVGCIMLYFTFQWLK